MIKSNIKISTKIKIYGFVLISIMMMAIMVTIYFNNKNIKDSLLINIAGQQRMLTQKISKEILYIYMSKNIDYSRLNQSIRKYIKNSNYIKNRKEIKKIMKIKNSKISLQMIKVDKLWKSFENNVQEFKSMMQQMSQDSRTIDIVEIIYNESTTLLREVNNLVSMLTIYTEKKNNNIKILQYISAILLLMLMFYIVAQLKHIEANAHSFMEYSKNLALSSDTLKIEPIHVEAEKELVEMDEIIQSFATKINSAIDFSNEALSQSEQASVKLEEISGEFDYILEKLSTHSNISEHLSYSEDMVIESTEELLNSTKKLQKLKKELDKLLLGCNIKSAN